MVVSWWLVVQVGGWWLVVDGSDLSLPTAGSPAEGEGTTGVFIRHNNFQLLRTPHEPPSRGELLLKL